ncbi:hypothetical protein Rsub_10910 [Raphidocelis subcapitata]|uniref:Uncharacterized protein n=1 Tax=Raphidocelis subcapitata TaxID=307507 RepID=A0A2V0PD25_9CHLO|nr:hypothetical protein Rsub_10910 [Raphidocelis subcapitata]|eukprot:GBF97746.1 hypothetical protein Rsub_10910 [Raphidocelis subcapitata]
MRKAAEWIASGSFQETPPASGAVLLAFALRVAGQAAAAAGAAAAGAAAAGAPNPRAAPEALPLAAPESCTLRVDDEKCPPYQIHRTAPASCAASCAAEQARGLADLRGQPGAVVTPVPSGSELGRQLLAAAGHFTAARATSPRRAGHFTAALPVEVLVVSRCVKGLRPRCGRVINPSTGNAMKAPAREQAFFQAAAAGLTEPPPGFRQVPAGRAVLAVDARALGKMGCGSIAATVLLHYLPEPPPGVDAPTPAEALAVCVGAPFVEASAPGALFVAVPSAPLGLAPLGAGRAAARAAAALRAAGLPPGAPLFLGGHSLGAAAAQWLVAADRRRRQPPGAAAPRFAGAVLLSSSLARRYRGGRLGAPWLSLSGELDGGFPPARAAEALFHAQPDRGEFVIILPGANHMVGLTDATRNALTARFDLRPEVPAAAARARAADVVNAFIFGGRAAAAAASAASAAAAAAAAAAAPAPAALAEPPAGPPPPRAAAASPPAAASRAAPADVLAAAQAESRAFLQPLIDALELEGSPFLRPPCDSDAPSPHCPPYPPWPPAKAPRRPGNDKGCACGVPFSASAVAIMAGLDPSLYRIASADAIHNPRNMTPFHHAHVWSDCTAHAAAAAADAATDAAAAEQAAGRGGGEGANTAAAEQAAGRGGRERRRGPLPPPCVLNVTTVSQPVYSWLERLAGTGLLSRSTAEEIRIKMKSRQVYRRASADPSADFSVDRVNACADINRAAYEWALAAAPPATRARFLRSGAPLRFAPDRHFPLPVGPLWIETPLRLRLRVDGQYNGGRPYLEVTSVSMRTDLDSWMNSLHPDSAGQHYCKALSPARALDWIYSQGLRPALAAGRAHGRPAATAGRGGCGGEAGVPGGGGRGAGEACPELRSEL